MLLAVVITMRGPGLPGERQRLLREADVLRAPGSGHSRPDRPGRVGGPDRPHLSDIGEAEGADVDDGQRVGKGSRREVEAIPEA